VRTAHANDPIINTVQLFIGFFNTLNSYIDKNQGVTTQRKHFKEFCEDVRNQISHNELINSDYDFSSFCNEYESIIKDIAEAETGMHITKGMQTEINITCFQLLQSPSMSDIRTGLVVAGFGAAEFFPSLMEYAVDGQIDGKCRVWQNRNEDLNIDGEGARIIPFAQVDVAHTFMEGINSEYNEVFQEVLTASLSHLANDIIDSYVPDGGERIVANKLQEKKIEAVVSAFSRRFEKLRREKSVDPILRVLRALPKEEMAALAEALVETTGLRRRMDSSIETVGGPVDVAVISKADGFIWIKRKHYFEPSLNHEFFLRKQQNGR
jgi:hypothetical protein